MKGPGKIKTILYVGMLLAASALYGKDSQDPELRALEESVKSNPQTQVFEYNLNGISQGNVYELKSGDYSIKIGSWFMIFKKKSEEKGTSLYDIGKDRIPERIIFTDGPVSTLEGVLMDSEGLRGIEEPDDLDISANNAIQRAGGITNRNTRTVVDTEGLTVKIIDYKEEEYETLKDEEALSFKESINEFYNKFLNKINDVFGK
ncbi:MAG: hypothetical protein QF506_03245 [Candidatus Woesearchaeota archaeon]|jgi:hypothetical protein|nr:hypothetical protein [Candidatus Woesearchaeota archaeon]|tara:strand:+ start:550 stop:1161 length:612 start_codon:yes stop_codon:yes gene_type:complete